MPIAGKTEGECMSVEWAEMNERGYFLKADIVSDFEFRSICMFGAKLRK